MSPNAKQKKKAGAQDMLYGTTLSAESIKVMAESSGVNSLCDDAAKELAESVSTQIKKVVECSMKFMHHSKRDRLTTNDIDSALRVFNVEPHYGFVCKTFTPFRFASGGGRELHFNEEREVDLKEVIDNSSHIKFPLELSIRAHWLAVDGIQPLIPENPPPLSKEAQALESVNPVAKLEQGITKESAGKPAIGKIHKLRNVETVHVKQLATHELSVEQQLYYKEITEACVGSDEPRRGEALQSLSSDPGLHEMLPRMCTFIAEGVKVNVVQNNLALLIYLMRMVKALLDNPSLYLEKYLHEILPSVTTCIVSRQMCMRPEIDNHWALRDFASRLMAQICKNFNTSTNNLQTRVTRIYSKALTNDKTHLSTLYGSLAGLAELGGEVVKVFIIPRLRFISERIESHLLGVTTTSGTDKTAAGHIRAMLQKCCPPVLRQIRNPPDLVEDYKNDYGFMGPSLCAAVQKSRTSPSSTPLTSSNFTTISSGPVTLAAQNVTKRVQMGAQTTRQTGTVVATLPQMRALQQTQPTKFIVMPQQPQQQQQQQVQQKPQIKQMVETTSPLTVVVGGETATQTSMLISRQSPVPMIMHSPNSATSGVRLIKPTPNSMTAQNTSPVFFTRQMSQSPAVYTQGISPQSVIISHDHDMGIVGTIAQDGSDIVVTQDDAVSEDVETVIIEDEEMHPPPELDDLSHLE